MNEKVRKIMIVSLVTALVLLSSLAVIPFGTTAASPNPKAPVGTVTLSPSTGAFPGQIVYYTWSGVPTDLVPPVYVTVYMNGAAYSTSVAYYDSANGVLKGTFVMPNDQPGTVFSVSFSYRDSAQNYGEQTVTGYTTLNVGMAPRENVTDYAEYSAYGTAHFSGNTQLDGWSIGTITSDNDNGSSVWNLNVSNKIISGTPTSLSNNTPDSQPVNINAQADYVAPVNFYENLTAHNTTVNATTVDKGKAILSLPSSDVIPSTFTLVTDGSAITKITTAFYVNTTVSGTPVVFKFDGIYPASITSPGAYTMQGTFVTLSPSSLVPLTGQFSASYDIHDFGYNGTVYYVNYTLSITFEGNYSYVSVSAQYLTSDYVNNTGSTTTFTNTTTVNLQSGYSFTSKYVGLQNPGIQGTYKFVFNNGSLYVNGTEFSFSNSTMADIINGLGTIYFNNTISMIGFNRTVTGAINITITTNYFVQGVYAISPAIWNFTLNISYSLVSDDGKISVSGYEVNPVTYATYENFSVNATVTPNHNFGNWPQVIAPHFNTTLSTYYGYPKLNYVVLGETNVMFTYYGQNAVLTLAEITLPMNYVVTPSEVGTTTYFYGYREITGLNETLQYGIYNGANYDDLNLTLTVNAMEPVIYGVTQSGVVNITYRANVSANDTNGYISFKHISLLNENVEISVGTLATDHPGVLATYNSELDLVPIGWYLYSTEFTATLETQYPGYMGTVTFNGAGSATGINTLLQIGTSIPVPGLITSVSGFANNSMGGWFNGSLYVSSSSYYALYGGVFKGQYYFYGDFNDIKKNSSAYPFFEGYLSTDVVVPIDYSLPLSNIYTGTGVYVDSSMGITDYMQSVNITNANVTGTQTFNWDVYGVSLTYTWYTGEFSAQFTPSSSTWSNSWTLTSLPELNVTGTPELDEAEVDVNLWLEVGSPLQNVSLIPIIYSDLEIYSHGGIGDSSTSVYYYLDSELDNSTAVLLNLNNGGVNAYDMNLNGYQDHEIKLQKYELTFYGPVDGITFSTDSVAVTNVGTYFIVGTATSVYGSGTVTGYVNVLQHTPSVDYYGMGYNDFVIQLHLVAHISAVNGTEQNVVLDLSNSGLIYSPSNEYYSWSISNVPYSYTHVMNMGSNTGNYEFGNYNLEQGSGAMIVTLSDEQVATIVTKLGDVVNISLSQLNAKVVGLWSTVNDTYALINTDFGQMSAKLDAIDAKITDVKNGIADIQTTLGNIQTSLSNLDSKITSLSNDVATVQTTLGNIQVSLNNLNATVVSNAKGIESLKGSVVDIQTSLGDIKGTVTDIKNGVATIQTDLGTVKTDVSNIKTTTANTSGNVNTTLYWEIGVLVLVIITLILVAFVIIKVNKISQGAVKEEKVEEEPEEETKEEE